jgi:3-methyl-2-oxobutanoate hydroxymethyltransferase
MRRTLPQLRAMKPGTPIVMATAYDAGQARLIDEAVDGILVGDSLGMVVQGHDSTLPVTLDEMVYHARMVVRGSRQACIVGDLPFMSYQASVEDAMHAAGRLIKEAGVQAVKLEGGAHVLPQVRALAAAGIALVGHIGLTPQAIGALGGYGKRGKSDGEAARIRDEALALEEAGLSLLVLENIPHALAREVTTSLRIPTIGIGAGPHCDGQIQVFHDLFGLDPDFAPRHAVRYAEAGRDIRAAAGRYAEDVRVGKFVSK